MTPELSVVIPKTEIITLGIASACTPRAFGLFGVDICNTECSRNPQNQYSIRLLAPTDNRKSFTLLPKINDPVL
jgi:hypothetical protein